MNLRTYYLVADINHSTGYMEVSVSDSAKGKTVLYEIPANSYTDAVKKVTFTINCCGKEGILLAKDAEVLAQVF